MADRFPFMRVYMEMADQLTKEDKADFYDALVHYALDGTEPEPSVGAAVFQASKRIIDKWKQTSAAGHRRAETAGRTLDGRWNVAGSEKPAEQQKPKNAGSENPAKEEKYKSIKDKKNNTLTESKKNRAQETVDLYNVICTSLPKATKLTEQRISHVNARLNEHTPEEIKTVFEKAQTSEFLTGKRGKWRADFD